jgi:hypothetical protein
MPDAIFTRSIWDSVKQHNWKFRPRAVAPNALLWHATRGGQHYDGRTEQQASINWFVSPNNIVHDPRFAPYAGISHVLIGPGDIVEVVPIGDFIPAFSSHPSDEHAISIEVAQSNLGQPIEPETIANCQRFAAWASAKYGFTLGRVYPTVSDWQWTGEAGHEDTFQGKEQGKTDPGATFWEAYLEDDMTPDEVAAIAAGQFLPLLAQAIGADVSTFSDQATVDRIREALQAMAKGGATPRLVYADIGRQIEQAGKAIQAAGNARTLGGAIS